MGNLRAYSAMTTKIRAMMSKLLTDEQYEEIASLGTVTELMTYLKRIEAYEKLFADMPADEIHRENAEWMLHFSAYNDYEKLYAFADRDQRVFLRFYFTKFEIFGLKRCIRRIFDAREYQIYSFGNHSLFGTKTSLPAKELAGAADMDEFCSLLRGSIYHSCVKKVNELENPGLFDYQAALDLFYFSHMWEQKDKLFKGNDLAHVKKSYGTKIDLLNIMWIYRCKSYYSLDASKIYSYIIPIRCRLKPAQLKAMIEAEDEKAFDAAYFSTDYAKKYRLKTGFSEIEAEKMYNSLMDGLYRSDFKNNPYSPAAIDTYFYLKELETSRIVTAAECIRYGYPPEKTLKLIKGKGVS